MIKIENVSAPVNSVLTSMDITAPLYWWKEFDACSSVLEHCYNRAIITFTIHEAADRDFTVEDFSCEHLKNYEGFKKDNLPAAFFWEEFKHTVIMLNQARQLYSQTEDKQYWWQIVQLLPSSYNQKRTVVFDYAALSDMRDHRDDKLDEWREFSDIAYDTFIKQRIKRRIEPK